MCIIISKPVGKTLHKDIYEESFRCNRDGAGFAYIESGRGIVIEKGFFSFDKFYEALLVHEQKPMIVHCRVASPNMAINADNTHPFSFTSEAHPRYSFALAHNGRLPYSPSKGRSDTASFCEDMLFPHLDRDPYFLDDWVGEVFLERFIGDFNKLVIFRYDSQKDTYKTYIINEDATSANKHKGCWFSNSSWKKVAPVHHNQSQFDDEDLSGYGWFKINGVWVKDDNWCKKQTPSATPPATGGTTTDFPKVVTPKEEDKKITVPREGKAKIDDACYVGAAALPHLSQSEKRDLRETCISYVRNAGVDTKGWSVGEIIAYVRSELQEVFPESKEMSMEQLDRWIISIETAPRDSSVDAEVAKLN